LHGLPQVDKSLAVHTWSPDGMTLVSGKQTAADEVQNAESLLIEYY
jgi:hypothetical protein